MIGASAGGFEALKTIVAGLPATFNAPILIVWHIAATTTGILPYVLNKHGRLNASNARDGASMLPGHIYIAPPDRHLLIEDGLVRVTHGPKENRFRPAIDPLFRSAANAWGPRVIGIVLSGALDDGSSGLWSIKEAGGIAIVQDPADADVSAMPENAMRAVQVDHCLPAAEIASLLVELSTSVFPKTTGHMNSPEQTQKEIAIAAQNGEAALEMFSLGVLSSFTCPECGGVLARFLENNRSRYRCHTGHAYSADVLLASITEQIEDSFYDALRRLDECVMLLNNMGDQFAAENDPKLAALYFRKALDAQARGNLMRKAIREHEQLSKDSILREAEGSTPLSGSEKE